jgi:hypothetical protein
VIREIVPAFLQGWPAVNFSGVAQATTGVAAAPDTQPFPKVAGVELAMAHGEREIELRILAEDTNGTLAFQGSSLHRSRFYAP